MLKLKPTQGESSQWDPSLLQLLTCVYGEYGLDFTQYKPRTLISRIRSRINRLKMSSYDEYGDYLVANPDEYRLLLNSLTINVTEFFRNIESFDVIQNKVIPLLLKLPVTRDGGSAVNAASSLVLFPPSKRVSSSMNTAVSTRRLACLDAAQDLPRGKRREPSR